MDNFTCNHESNYGHLGLERFSYEDQHIEVDNRMIWFLELLEERYDFEDCCFVHLHREREKVVQSFGRRWLLPNSIIRAFTIDICGVSPLKLRSRKQRRAAIELYYDVVNTKIKKYTGEQYNSYEVNLERLEADFSIFWDGIGAVGDKEKALQSLQRPSNRSRSFKI